jgi:hypothetical protein
MFVRGHCVTSRIENELAVVTYQLVKEHQACGLKGLVFALDLGGHIDVICMNALIYTPLHALFVEVVTCLRIRLRTHRLRIR